MKKKPFLKLFLKGKSLYLFILVGMIFFSCSRKPVNIPETVLSREEMVSVLVDIHLAQALVGINQFNDSLHYNLSDYLSSVFQMHHLTREKYARSLEFYTDHPELLDEMYADVINELSKKQSETSGK
jgi:hypothetical protein